MNKEEKKWFSISESGSFIINCAFCLKSFDLEVPFVDHHPSCCPICGVECVFLDWGKMKIQVILQNAPSEFMKLIRWIQENFDELEYVELLTSLEEIVEALKANNS